MAVFNDRRCHLVFMDSRGTGLQEKIVEMNHGEYLEVRVCKGSTLHQLSRAASAHLTRYPFDVVYIAGGICDVTTKCQKTQRISFNWESGEKLTMHLARALDQENSFLSKNHPASKIVFCPLVGAELARVVDAHPTTQIQQSFVDEAIFDFNNHVFKIKGKLAHNSNDYSFLLNYLIPVCKA